jgi:hypothetical protein
MFKLDNEFLKEIGRDDMPEVEKAAFLEHLQEELEVRIGERMSEGLTEEQIEEFEHVIDGDMDTIQRLLTDIPNYKEDPTYQKLLLIGATDDSPEILTELVSVKWLEKNRPDYQDLVTAVASELKSEVTADKDSI